VGLFIVGVRGIRLADWNPVGMVFQSFNLFAHKTILENVTLGPNPGRPRRRISNDDGFMPGLAGSDPRLFNICG
jgi:hypothetical protein